MLTIISKSNDIHQKGVKDWNDQKDLGVCILYVRFLSVNNTPKCVVCYQDLLLLIFFQICHAKFYAFVCLCRRTSFIITHSYQSLSCEFVYDHVLCELRVCMCCVCVYISEGCLYLSISISLSSCIFNSSSSNITTVTILINDFN